MSALPGYQRIAESNPRRPAEPFDLGLQSVQAVRVAAQQRLNQLEGVAATQVAFVDQFP